ncbi:MAG: hypothetical protein KDD51_11030 [Bdellovibrionales bacterium]|nr:hypothetical protein [Bdellovibrionales bacterium]
MASPSQAARFLFLLSIVSQAAIHPAFAGSIEKTPSGFPDRVSDRRLKACRLTPSDLPDNKAVVNLPEEFPEGKLFMGGGGWAAEYDTDLINDIKDHGKKVVINLSAAKNAEGAAKGCLGWQKKLGIPKADITCLFIRPENPDTLTVSVSPASASATFSERRFRLENGERVEDINGPNSELVTTTTPIATSKVGDSQSVTLVGNLDAAAKKITPDTSHFIIGGGFPWMLDESINSSAASATFWKKISDRHKEGAYVYGSSAGTDIVGPLNTGKLLSHLKPTPTGDEDLQLQRRYPTSYFQRPGIVPGAGISPVSFMSHGADDPRLIERRFGAGTYQKEASTAEDGSNTVRESFLTTNPQAFLHGIQDLVWKPSDTVPGKYQITEPLIVVPQEAYATLENGKVRTTSSHSAQRFLIIDPRHPPTKSCDLWYVVPGEVYNLKTGLVEVPSDDAPLAAH